MKIQRLLRDRAANLGRFFYLGSVAAIVGSSYAQQGIDICNPGPGIDPMAAESESFDGRTRDITGPSVVTSSTDRVWIAHGRIRSALNPATRQRDFNQDTTFDIDGVGPERVLAVELCEATGVLYTLTEKALYAEDPLNPSSRRSYRIPEEVDTLPPVGTIPVPYSVGAPVDVKCWPAGGSSSIDAVFVLTTKTILILEDTGSQLVYLAAPDEMARMWLRGDAATSKLECRKVQTFRRFRLCQDQNGMLIAYVAAQSAGYPGRSSRPANGGSRLSEHLLCTWRDNGAVFAQ